MSVFFPQGTEMFHFPHLPPSTYVFSRGCPSFKEGRVAPFGNPRLGLLDSSPGLFAVVPRPSSALDAKASTARPFLLNLLQV